MEDSQWVDGRMATLDPATGWRPDTSRALGRLHHRRRARRVNWICGFAAAAALVIGVSAITPRACANPLGCGKPPASPAATRTVPSVAPLPAVAVPPPAQKPASRPPAPNSAPAPVNYKQSGNPHAPIACEIYSDYECPACAYFYKETMPQLVAEYVKTGKIKILHRDYPLQQHAYARAAARYANASGAIGKYDAVADRLFRSQEIWSVSGDIATALAPTLTPDEMKRVEHIIETDAHIDDTVAVDMAMGQKDQLHQTPTLVIVAKGKRQVVAPIPAYSLLKSYLDALLSQ